MFFSSSLLFSLLLLWVSTDGSSALEVTSPSEGFFWNGNEPLVVQWAAVQTDPSYFGIQITNNDPNTYPQSMNRIVTKGVSTSAGSYTIQGRHGFRAGSGYQINLVSDQNAGILAQSARFSISGGSGGFDPTGQNGSGYNNSISSASPGWNSNSGDFSNGNSNMYQPVNGNARYSSAPRLSVSSVQIAAAGFLIISLCCV